MGFSVPRRLRFARCALTAPFHHHPDTEMSGLSVFCGTVRRKTSRFSARVYLCFAPVKDHRYKLRGIAPFGVRTFLPRLAPEAILRPSKTNPI
jgi:hypothetical protein